MHRLTSSLLRLLVFSLGLEYFVTLAAVGSVTRLLGLVVITAGLLTVAASGRIRQPTLVVALAFAFAGFGILSLLWTISYIDTVRRVTSYVQLVGLLWIIWQFARTVEEQDALMTAYCLGASTAIADLLWSFAAGGVSSKYGLRYVSTGFDPNDLGLMLAIGIPMAWYMVMQGGRRRLLGLAYLPVALLAILLTASRGALLATLAAATIIPLSLPRQSLRSGVLLMAVLLVAATGAALFVPEGIWSRLTTTGQEVTEGSMSGRTRIWAAGLQVYAARPVLGTGVGAFAAAVEHVLGRRTFSHNVFLAILVELGILGFFLFTMLLAACAWAVYRMPPSRRTLWAVIGLTWTVGAMSLGWEYRKITWLLFGMVAAQSAATAVPTSAAEMIHHPGHAGVRQRVWSVR